MSLQRRNADIKNSTYENVMVDCPHCGREIVLNRRTDIESVRPISGLEVTCIFADCGQPIWIAGDSVNDAYEMLLFECYELVERKRYMSCVLSVAQAFEMFFNLALRVDLLYKPFAGTSEAGKLARLNQVADLLSEKTRRYAFDLMRATFLTHVIEQRSPKNLKDAEQIITGLPDKPSIPKDADILALSDAKIAALLIGVKNSTVGQLRNSVVHKIAYRPTKDEAVEALEEAMSLLPPLGSRMGLHDDVNWYGRRN